MNSLKLCCVEIVGVCPFVEIGNLMMMCYWLQTSALVSLFMEIKNLMMICNFIKQFV